MNESDEPVISIRNSMTHQARERGKSACFFSPQSDLRVNNSTMCTALQTYSGKITSPKDKWNQFKHRRAIVINNYIEMKKQQINCKILLQYIYQWKLTVNIRAAIDNWKLQFKKRFKAKIICAIAGPLLERML